MDNAHANESGCLSDLPFELKTRAMDGFEYPYFNDWSKRDSLARRERFCLFTPSVVSCRSAYHQTRDPQRSNVRRIQTRWNLQPRFRWQTR